jgi:hypothetical protein
MVEINREEGTWYVFYNNQSVGYLEDCGPHTWSLCFVLAYPIATQIEILQELEKVIERTKI